MPEAGAPGGSGHDESILRSFVPSPVLANFDAGHHDWLGELRTVTVVFAGLPDLGSESPLIVAQELVTGAQIKVAQVDASLNKISVDDKGIAVLAALGMPPRAHEDDGVRGARLGLELARVATNAGNRCYVGVATGRVFCGTIGNDNRLEYTPEAAGGALRSARLRWMPRHLSAD